MGSFFVHPRIKTGRGRALLAHAQGGAGAAALRSAVSGGGMGPQCSAHGARGGVFVR